MNDISIEVVGVEEILVSPQSQIASPTITGQDVIDVMISDNNILTTINSQPISTAVNGDVVSISVDETDVSMNLTNQPVSVAATINEKVDVTVPTEPMIVNASVSPFDGITEAPSNGSKYARQDKTWVVIGDGGGLPEAPIDGEIYGRKNGAWSAIGLIILNIDGGNSESFP